MWLVLVFELLVLAAVCGIILRVFASFKRTPWYAIASTWLGWLLCFAIVLLVPIDILDSDHEACLTAHPDNTRVCTEPISYLPMNIMIAQWSALYWGTLVMSWLGYPLLQTYSLAGDFTLWERIIRSIKENIYIYIGMAIVGSIFLVALAIAGGISGQELLNLVMALANAYGLILVVVLMGYGLVDIPRYLFRKADREKTLTHYHAQASKLKDTMESAKEDLTNTLKLVKKYADKIEKGDPYRTYMETILQKCPEQYGELTAGEGDSSDMTMGKLVALHSRVRDDTHAVARAVCLYEMLLKKAFKIEDIIKIKEDGGTPDKKIHYSFTPPRTYKYAYIVDTLEYYWEIYVHPSAYRILASAAAVLSVLIVWCEITLVVNKEVVDLSPFSQLIKALHMEGFGKQLFCFIPLTYMAVCAYTTLFKIRLFNYYRLVPHQMSDANSIMFSANYLCRLVAPLAFNFLKLVNQVDSSFNTVMGDMNAFPILGKEFTVFFPIFVAVLCIFSLFNVWSKIGSMCCIKKLRYIPSDDFKLVSEGQEILKQERETKEGRGPTNKSFKADIKSKIKNVTGRIMGKTDEKPETPEKPVAAPLPVARVPDPPADIHKAPAAYIRNKYSKLDDGADVPSTSRFANSASPSTSSLSSNRHRDDDLIPKGSKFAKNSAIVDVVSEEPAAIKSFSKSTHSPATSSTQKPSFSLWGGKNNRNDEVVLLPRGSGRSDSNV